MAKKSFPWGKVALVGGTLAGVALAYYARRGAGSEKNAVLIPDVIEDEIDKVVDQLNERFDREWVTRGLDALTLGLAATLSPTGKLLLAVLDEVEQWASDHPNIAGINLGPVKRKRAADMFRERHPAHA
ncbi:hypothetical protein [Chondromyces apiculatus]|uniref:Uncharacterized protein n=1 Tax=Chondromyces apiculatus DSM 436 TaxID=1192034 RepID=A0A017TCI2_9BACT|nr:hypothetical protein [Chondromyces apiculatus]EYF06959.1 Hypothetical protein CAP_1218 [Chondromyces apiculatus DSM 436]